MRMVVQLLLIVLLAGAGCTTKSKARQRAQTAYIAGQLSAVEAQKRQAGISFVGEVRNTTVPWSEGLTLAKAIVQAEYTGFIQPRQVVVTRSGQQYTINARDLLRGDEGPLLQPGDTVEIRR